MKFSIVLLLSLLATPCFAERMALVDKDGNVVNVIVVEPDTKWTPPDGVTIVPADGNAEPGGTYDGSAFIRAVPKINDGPPSFEEQLQELRAKIEALEARVFR